MFAYGLVPVSKSSTQALAHTTMVLELSGRETLNKTHRCGNVRFSGRPAGPGVCFEFGVCPSWWRPSPLSICPSGLCPLSHCPCGHLSVELLPLFDVPLSFGPLTCGPLSCRPLPLRPVSFGPLICGPLLALWACFF